MPSWLPGRHKCMAAIYAFASASCAGVMLMMSMQILQRIQVTQPMMGRQAAISAEGCISTAHQPISETQRLFFSLYTDQQMLGSSACYLLNIDLLQLLSSSVGCAYARHRFSTCAMPRHTSSSMLRTPWAFSLWYGFFIF